MQLVKNRKKNSTANYKISLDEIPNYGVKLLTGDLNAEISNLHRGLHSVPELWRTAREINDTDDRMSNFCCKNGTKKRKYILQTQGHPQENLLSITR